MRMNENEPSFATAPSLRVSPTSSEPYLTSACTDTNQHHSLRCGRPRASRRGHESKKSLNNAREQRRRQQKHSLFFFIRTGPRCARLDHTRCACTGVLRGSACFFDNFFLDSLFLFKVSTSFCRTSSNVGQHFAREDRNSKHTAEPS